MPKLSEKTYNKIVDLLVEEANNTDNPEYYKELEDMLNELDTIGIY